MPLALSEGGAEIEARDEAVAAAEDVESEEKEGGRVAVHVASAVSVGAPVALGGAPLAVGAPGEAVVKDEAKDVGVAVPHVLPLGAAVGEAAALALSAPMPGETVIRAETDARSGSEGLEEGEYVPMKVSVAEMEVLPLSVPPPTPPPLMPPLPAVKDALSDALALALRAPLEEGDTDGDAGTEALAASGSEAVAARGVPVAVPPLALSEAEARGEGVALGNVLEEKGALEEAAGDGEAGPLTLRKGLDEDEGCVVAVRDGSGETVTC